MPAFFFLRSCRCFKLFYKLSLQVQLLGYLCMLMCVCVFVHACLCVMSGATLSQLSDSGQTLSEDSGVDIAEAGGMCKDSSPRPGKIVSQNASGELRGAERAAQVPNHQVRERAH